VVKPKEEVKKPAAPIEKKTTLINKKPSTPSTGPAGGA
jgi:hypothetical protein